MTPGEFNAKKQTIKFELDYPDAKFGYFGTVNSGPIVFKLPGGGEQINAIIVCDGNDGKLIDPDHEKCDLTKHTHFWVNDIKIESKTITVGGTADGRDPCIRLEINSENLVEVSLGVEVVESRVACAISQVVKFVE